MTSAPMRPKGPAAPFMRYPGAESKRRLSLALDLAWDPQMQDWDLENSNAKHLPRLFAAHESPELPDDDRFCLVMLMVACVDEHFQTDGPDEALWARIEAVLMSKPELHAATIWYWASPVLSDEEGFAISDRMAILWRRIETRVT